MTRTQLLVLALAALAAVLLAWLVKSGLWRRHRLAFVVGAVAIGLLALTRRVGLQELAILGGLVIAAAIFIPARR